MVESTDQPTTTHSTSPAGGDADVSRGVAIGAMAIVVMAIAISLFAVMKADARSGLDPSAIGALQSSDRPPAPSTIDVPNESSTTVAPSTTVLSPTTASPTTAAPTTAPLLTTTTSTQPSTTVPSSAPATTTTTPATTSTTSTTTTSTTTTTAPTTTLPAPTTTTSEAPLPVSHAIVGASDAFVDVGQTKARIHWVAPADPNRSAFRLSRVAGGDRQSTEVAADRTSHEFVDLRPDTDYELTLVAVGPFGNPANESRHTVNIRTLPARLGAPTPVTNLQVYPGADGRSATVTWDAADDPAATAFFVSWGCCGEHIDGRFVGRHQRSYTVTGLTPGVEHTFELLVRGPDLETDEGPQGTRVTKKVTLPG